MEANRFREFNEVDKGRGRIEWFVKPQRPHGHILTLAATQNERRVNRAKKYIIISDEKFY